MSNKEDQALCKDEGKTRYDLLPPEPLEELCKVYTWGAEQKYEPRNWEKGINFGRRFSSCMRHLWVWWRGEDFDKESGLHHLAHAAWNIFALLTYVMRGMNQFDDRSENTDLRTSNEGNDEEGNYQFEPITSSLYKREGELVSEEYSEGSLYSWVRKNIKWYPDSFWTLDVAIVNNVPKILEIGAFSCSGVYACDYGKVILKVVEHMELCSTFARPVGFDYLRF